MYIGYITNYRIITMSQSYYQYTYPYSTGIYQEIQGREGRYDE